MIRIRHLTKRIGSTVVLSDVSMDMLPGRVTGLTGPNGSGKTMLMRVIVGLVKPTSGSVEVFGRDAWSWRNVDASDAARDTHDVGIGLLLEGPSFLDGYTGLKNLELLASIRGVASRDDIREAIVAMGLDPDDRRAYRAYSLGMKQRLGIAAAVMEKPDILIVDEPTNALDADGVERAAAQIREARERGSVVVLASHDTAVLRDLSDDIWYLAEGHVEGHEAGGGVRS